MLRRPVEPSVYTSIAFIDRLIYEGIDPSVGFVDGACDNIMVLLWVNLCKAELFHLEGPWRHVDQVEAATGYWVHRFKTVPIHSSIDDLTPFELEGLDYALAQPLERAG